MAREPVAQQRRVRAAAGKVYLSPIVDCFDGMSLSWSISTSPDAEMANSSLFGACGWLGEGDHPKIHSASWDGSTDGPAGSAYARETA